VGKHPAGARPPIQGHRHQNVAFPMLIPAASSIRRSTTSRVSQSLRLSPSAAEKNLRNPGHSPYVGNHYRPHVVEVDFSLSRPAGVDEPVEQRGALELRTKLFLRTLEFYCRKATPRTRLAKRPRRKRANADIYADFAINDAAIPVIPGKNPMPRNCRRGRHLFD